MQPSIKYTVNGYSYGNSCEVWWLIGRFVAFCPKGREFESHASRHEGILGKSFISVACGASAWNSDTVSVLCRDRLWAVVDLKRRYKISLNEWMNELWLWLGLRICLKSCLIGSRSILIQFYRISSYSICYDTPQYVEGLDSNLHWNLL